MRKFYLFLLVAAAQVLAGITVHAQTQTLFDYASQWKYLDNGTDQGTAWKDVGFNDNTWAEAAGVFGYGDSWITACLTKGASPACPAAPTGCTSSYSCPKYITYYFRKTLNISNTSLYSSVTFNVWRDDAVIIYVNGVKVSADANMPTGTVTYLTNSLATVDGAAENTPVAFSVPISNFVNGDNVIAVEVHQRDNASSDLTFNMQALGVLTTTLIAPSSTWKYLSNGSNQGTAWLPISIDESAWASGTAHIGYGDSWITTCILAGAACPAPPTGCTSGVSCATKYITSYFRKTINLPNPSVYDSVKLTYYVDDGAVVYVNGVEVDRYNLPTGTITSGTLAVSGSLAENFAVNKTIPISYFTTGNNVIAVEVHQNAASSSDLDFELSATGIIHIPAAITRGPYLQKGNETAFTVRWRTNIATKSKLEVGTVAGTYPIVVNDAAVVTEHEVRVTGLNPDTKYFYRFGSDVDVLQGDTTNFCVTAPATPRRVTIAAYGDCGQNSNGYQTGSLSAYRSYLTSIGLKAADIMLLVGDNAYNNGTDAEYQTGFFNAYQGNILKNHMLFPAPGNHDYDNGSSARQNDHNVPYYSIFSMPQNGECGGVASNNEAYYSYNWGDVHVLSLDSYGRENAGTTRLYDTLGAQVQWIKADLAANTRKWVIAYWHHPPYTMGSHNSNSETELVNIRQNFIRILERYGVDLIICGHSHDYERSYLMKGHYGNEASFNAAAHAVDNSSGKYDGSANSCPYTTTSGQVNHGTVYVVSGSSGASGGVQSGYPHDAMPFSLNDGGMFFLDINNNRLDAKFIRQNGTIWDKFTIMKDVKKQDTVEILHGASTDLSASWEGNYTWGPGVTTRTVTVTPMQDTLVEVKDNATATCLTDKHYVNMLCTMPGITSSPADIVRDGCDAAVIYSLTDTGRPAPAVTYAFAGATTGMGNGTGSGTTFSTGVTTVTLTAANECGSTSTSFTITINALPEAYAVTGGGGYCPGAAGVALGLAGSEAGVAYQLYDGATAIGSPVGGTGAAISFGTVTAVATYSVLATHHITGCMAAMANTADVFIHVPPVAYPVAGGGNYCTGGTGMPVGLDNSQANVSYQLYAGATAIGSAVTGTGAAISFGTFTAAGTYSVSATDDITTCTNSMTGTATIGINPLPAVYSVTGGGHYCDGGIGMPVGLDNSASGISYQLYNGAAPVGAPVAGIDGAISFGNQVAAAVYTVLATDDITGCTGNMTGTATVATDLLPAVQAISAGGSYCSGGTGVAISLAGTESGISYQLYYGATAQGAAVNGTGSSISFGLQTGAGGYTATALNTATGCENVMGGIATIGIYGLPAVYAVTGGGSYCAGGTGVAVGLGGSSAGINYRLYNGATPVGAAVNGTGSPLSFGVHTAAGAYTIKATDNLTTCLNNMAGTATVAITPLAVPSSPVTVFPNDTVCEGTTVMFSTTAVNGGAAPGFEWKVNGITVLTSAPVYSYTPAHGDVVSVILSSSLPCITNPAVTTDKAMTVRANVMPSATVTATPGDSVCDGTFVSFTVTATNGGTDPSYTWLRNSIMAGTGETYAFTPADGDAVVVSMTSSAPCRLAGNVYSNVLAMQVDESYIPEVSISAVPGVYISRGQPVTFTANVAKAGPNPAYQWYKNSAAIAAATSAVFTTKAISDKDTITCTVKGGGLCGREGFNALVMNVVATGVQVLGKQGTISVVPNPTTGEFTVEGALGLTTTGAVTLTVTNMLAQEIYSRSVTPQAGKINERISLGNHIADGSYLLTLSSAKGKQVFHIILKR